MNVQLLLLFLTGTALESTATEMACVLFWMCMEDFLPHIFFFIIHLYDTGSGGSCRSLSPGGFILTINLKQLQHSVDVQCITLMQLHTKLPSTYEALDIQSCSLSNTRLWSLKSKVSHLLKKPQKGCKTQFYSPHFFPTCSINENKL